MSVRVLVVNRFFAPDEAATAMLAVDIAAALERAGCEVHVACSRASYRLPEGAGAGTGTGTGRGTGEAGTGTGGAGTGTGRGTGEAGRGTGTGEAGTGTGGAGTVHRLWSTRFDDGRAVGRILNAASFQLAFLLWGLLGPRFDARLVMTDPPLLLGAGVVLRALRGGRLVHLVADVYPDIAVALGVLAERSLLVRLLDRSIAGWLRRCDAVLALGERMAERLLERGVDPARLQVTPPWAVEERAGEPGAWRGRLGLGGDDCLVMYSGTMGRCHPHATVLAAMRALAPQRHVHWLFVGDGCNLRALRAEVERLGLPRATFLPYQRRSDLPDLLAAGDLHLVVQDPRTVGLCVPSKLAGILAASRPLLFVGDERAEIAGAVHRFACGRVVAEEDGAGLAAAIGELAADPALRARLGAAGRVGFEAELSAARVLPRVVAAVTGVA